MSIILHPGTPALTLDDALLSMSIFTNGCDFKLRFEGRRVFLQYGCYGVHTNLVQGHQAALMRWLNEGGGDRELLDVSPETLMELKSRKPCQHCDGFLLRDAS